jgi:hypothetical protein
MSDTSPPVACTLTAAELPARAAELRALGEDALLSSSVDGGRAVLRFRGDAEARVSAAVAAERECCAFLRFDVERDGDELVLTIVAPDGAAETAGELAASFGGRR